MITLYENKEDNDNNINNIIESNNQDNNINNIIESKSKESKNPDLCKKKKKDKTDNCRELKNIAYKTMLLNGNEIVPDVNNTNNNTLSKYLENESIANQKENWSKLDKTLKVKRICSYVEILKTSHDLNDDEVIKTRNYLLKCLERKALNKAKDVNYDKEKGTITNIPNLYFENSNRLFILKKDDKHVSTVKCLPLEKKSKVKTLKIHE